jgi:hypothetical protein
MSSPDAADDATAASRRYLELQPATEPIDPTAIDTAFRRLHGVDPDLQLEWLLVASNGGVKYYLGTDAEHFRTVKHAITALFPNETTIKPVTETTDPIADALPAGPSDDTADAETTDEVVTDGAAGDVPPAEPRPTSADGPTSTESADSPAAGQRAADADETEPVSGDAARPTDRPPRAAVQYHTAGDRRRDWQMGLRPVTDPAPRDTTTERRVQSQTQSPSTPLISPLAGVIDTLADAPDGTVAVYQALIEPYRNWDGDRQARIEQLEWGRDTLGSRITDFIFGDFGQPDPEDLLESSKRRLEELEAAAPRHAFIANARAYVDGPEARSIADELRSVFRGIDGEFYPIVTRLTTGADTDAVRDALRERRLRRHPRLLRRLLRRLPIAVNASPAIITDPTTAPALCIVDGAALTQTGQQAVDKTHPEQTGVTPPPDAQLASYDGPGLTLGRLLDANDERTDRTVAVPPPLQPLHVAWVGKTGSGKSVGLTRAALDNSAATDGPAILVDSKGDGMAEDLLKAYYRRHGNLDDVYYFECDRFVPAISFFDIRGALAAGIPRTSAVEDTIDHYIEILEGIMGTEEFHSKRAPDVIRYLLQAMYDPVHGGDAFTQSEFDSAAKRMQHRQSPPAVSNPHLERMLAGIAEDRSDVFEAVMQAVNGRIEKVTRDRRIARLFDHAPPPNDDTDDTAPATDTRMPAGESGLGDTGITDTSEAATDAERSQPLFDLSAHLDEDALIVLDTGGLRTDAQRALVLVVLSNLWAALRQRERRHDARPAAEREINHHDDHNDPDDYPDTTYPDDDYHDTDDDPPLVNLYIEEAADIADTSLVTDLLAKSRSFGLSLTLAMQFPGQLEQSAPRTYAEVLNNVSTIVTGNVGRDRPLADRLATDDMPPERVATRLRGLRRGQWLAKLPAEFDEPEPRPFLLASADPPTGHPASDDPLSPGRLTAFDAALYVCKERTRDKFGLTVAQPSVVDTDGTAVAPGGDADQPAAADEIEDAGLRPRVDTTLPYTKRLPDHLRYDEVRHALVCTGCEAMYDPDSHGLARAMECCPEGAIDADDVPICEVTLKLSRAERRACEYSDPQLMFLQAVYNAAQLRYDPPAYDLLTDSMLRLREYVGVDAAAVDDLLDAGLLRHDTDHPHRLYTVSPDGRSLIGEDYRRGVAHGHAKGDLGESSQHVMGVEVARRWLHQAYVDDPAAAVETVVPYYDLGEDALVDEADADGVGNARRLDVAGLDADGGVVVCVEVERVNNDLAEAAPADYEKMAACNPEEAIWVVMTQADGHAVLRTLNRSGHVEKTYADTTPPHQFRLDEPGLTAMYPVMWLQERLE